MKQKLLFLLTALMLLSTGNAWGVDVASHDFNDQTTPFTIYDNNRLSVTYPEYVADGGDRYAKYNCSNMNKVAFAYYNFATNVLNAATVTISFDFNVESQNGHALISIADANVHTREDGGFTEKSNTGYGSNGVIFNLGCYRAGGNNKFGINSTQNNLAGLDAWCHASITVNNANRTVDYTITKGGSTLTSGSGVSFLSSNAERCSQIDIYIGNNGTNMNASIDNLVITKTVSDVSHNYTINAVAGGSTIKTNIKSGSATEGASYTVSGLPYVVEKDGKFYVLDDANVTNNGVTFTMLNADQTKTVNYTLDESIVYFNEAESFGGSSGSTAQSRASGGAYTNYFQSIKTNDVTTLNKGVYRAETYIWDRTNKEINLYKTSKDDANILASLTGSGSQSKNFLIDVNSTAIKLSSVNNSCCFDYILIRKLYDIEGEIVGAVDCSIDYLQAMTEKVALTPGQSYHYEFVNHNMGSTAGWAQNWILPVYASDGATKRIVIRSDNWEDIAWKNDGFSWIASTGNWYDDFLKEMDGASVDMTVSYSANKVFNMLSTITTSTGRTLTYSYNSSDAGVTLTDNAIKVALSISMSWLELTSEEGSVILKVNDGKLGTFIAPFDVELPAGVKAYSATSDAEKVILTKEYEGGQTLPAGTPVIVYGDGVTVNETFYGAFVVNENRTVGALTGSLSDRTIPSGSYVLQTQDVIQAFYPLASDAIGAINRCYVTANSVGEGARLAIVFDDDDPTAINAVEAAEPAANALKDGKYLIGNKIVLVKNGQKYSANGQKLN